MAVNVLKVYILSALFPNSL